MSSWRDSTMCGVTEAAVSRRTRGATNPIPGPEHPATRSLERVSATVHSGTAVVVEDALLATWRATNRREADRISDEARRR